MTDHSSSKRDTEELINNLQAWLTNSADEDDDEDEDEEGNANQSGFIHSSILPPNVAEAINDLVSLAQDADVTIQINYATKDDDEKEMGMAGWTGEITPCEFLATAIIIRGKHEFSHAVMALAEQIPWLISDEE